MYIIIQLSIILASYIICAYATTDISRFIYSSANPYITFHSYCPNCGHLLSALDQLPIISYYTHKGSCKYCSAPIPRMDHLLEVGLFAFLTIVNVLLGFSTTAFLVCVAGYEVLKVAVIITKKPRTEHFIRTFILSTFMNCFIFLIYGFLFLLPSLI